jgi:hypothetical protein
MKIEKNIPLPEDDTFAKELAALWGVRATPGIGRRNWPFKDMVVGDSVMVPREDWPAAQNVINMRRYLGKQDFRWYKQERGVRVYCTQDNREPHENPNARRRWGFSLAALGQLLKWNAKDFGAAKNAMRASTRITGFKFQYACDGKICVFKRIE